LDRTMDPRMDKIRMALIRAVDSGCKGRFIFNNF
jgi:hypothetical protein